MSEMAGKRSYFVGIQAALDRRKRLKDGNSRRIVLCVPKHFSYFIFLFLFLFIGLKKILKHRKRL